MADPPTFPEPPVVKYKFNMPPGKLPWPHQSPELTREEYDHLVDTTWIAQNYGQHTDPGKPYEPYTDGMHDALDIVVPESAKVYAVEDGYVAQASGGVIVTTSTSYRFAKERTEWSYVHVGNYQVRVGQRVVQGQYLGNVEFAGLPHVHLPRHVAGGGWNRDEAFADLVFPDDFFDYPDTGPPIIDPEFYFFKNNTDERIPRTADGTMVVSGDVDIVVGIREVGEYAHSKDALAFGDRLAVTGAKYVITGNGIAPYEVEGLDFRKLNLNVGKGQWAPSILYKRYLLLATNTSWDKRFSYYILSNFDGPRKDHFLGSVEPTNCWRTDMRDPSGNRRFPDGIYTITVTSWDAKGNRATASNQVVVRTR